jgi:hypothetical protein
MLNIHFILYVRNYSSIFYTKSQLRVLSSESSINHIGYSLGLGAQTETLMVVTGICLVIVIVYGTLEIYFHKVVGFRQKKSWKI